MNIRQVFTLLEVARHLAGNHDDSVEIEGLIAELVAAEEYLRIKRSGVKCSNGTWNYWYPQKSTVTRERLLLWCEQRAIRPAFLFPDPDPPLPEKPLQARERETLLAIIRALAELHQVQPIPTRQDGDGWRKAAEALLKECACRKIKPPVADPKTLTTHLRNAFANGNEIHSR